MSKDYKIRNVIKNVLNELWVIEPDKLEVICEFLELRAAGEPPSEQMIRETFGSSESESDGLTIIDGVQVIDIDGTLAPRMNLMQAASGGTSTMKLEQVLKEAAANDEVKSVILRIDSPGGAVSYTPEAAAAVRQLTRSKRVVASASNMMASGAYWIGSAANEVYASESTSVGSIGVFSILRNIAEAAEKSGVKFRVMRAGAMKGAGNPYEELTSERAQALQARIDQIYQWFTVAVAEHRGTSQQNVAKNYGQGLSVFAEEAKAIGMIDDVATFAEVFERERSRLTVSHVSPGVSIGGSSYVKGETMNPRIRAALFAQDFIADLEASDDICLAALKVLGVSADEPEKAISAINAHKHKPEPVAVQTAPTTIDGPSKVDAQATTLAERTRITELQARGRILGVDSEQVQSAIDGGVSVLDALDKWTQSFAHRETSEATITPGPSQSEKISAAGVAVLSERFGLANDESERRAAGEWGSSFRNSSFLDICRPMMESKGIPVTGHRETDAETLLRSSENIFAMSPSANRRGDHADMLSQFSNKAFREGAVIAPVTYPQWCDKIEDLPDFKPKSFIETGIFQRLNAITEEGRAEQLKFNSGLHSWIKADRYAGKVGLTYEMVVDDDMGGFVRMLQSLGTASRMTVQEVILDHFHSNPVMMDGNAFFSAAHGNLISSGAGAPGASQYDTHRKTHRLMNSYGSNFPMGLTFDRILVPVEHETVALQTTRPLYEVKTPQTDATVNTFRGQVMPIVDAYLDGYSTDAWYSLLPPNIAAAVVYAFRTGFGEDGRQREYYDAESQTRFIEIETQFGVAMGNWRAAVKNNGA